MHYVTELFINYEQQYKPYFHVFFDDKKEEENYPTNLNLGIIDSFKHLIRANITNKQKEIIKGYCYGKQKIKKKKIIIDYPVTSLKGLFKDCNSLKEINFIQFYRKNIVDMSQMFYNCTGLIKLNFSSFNSVNVKNMSDMFSLCVRLKKYDFSNFSTENVTDMSYMFSECTNL